MLPDVWHIDLFGGLRLRAGERTIEQFRTHKTGALLAYLALHSGQLHARDVLSDLFWSDSEPSAARTNLRVALNSLRRQLEPMGVATGSVLWASSESVDLRPAAIVTDVARFESCLALADSASSDGDSSTERRSLLREAIALYRGRLLPHIYDDWAVRSQERLAGRYFDALRLLSSMSEQAGDAAEALDAALRALSVEPLVEDSHATVIRLYIALGQPAAARDHYSDLVRLLGDTFGDTPSPETRGLLDPGNLGARLKSVASKAVANRAKLEGCQAVASPVGKDLSMSEWLVSNEIRSAPAIRLPLPLTRFFGRESERTSIETLLRAADARLITLTGPGGSGKTRLAVEAARQASGQFTAVFFVALADRTHTGAVPDAIIAALGLSSATQADPWEACIRRLRSGRILLILDNFEHLLGEAAMMPSSLECVESLLRDAPELLCLVTSRSRLRLSGERVLQIGPLPTVDVTMRTGESHYDHGGVDCLPAAAALFVDRAQASRPDFQLTARNRDVVFALCQRLDGLPLAIELAAAWAQTLTPAQMLGKTDSRFTFLVGRDRNLAPRHRSLEAAISWSFAALSVELRELLTKVVVFSGGWTWEAARDICLTESDHDDGRCLQLLTELRECSLLVAEERSCGEQTYIRFRMLETIREFCTEQGAKAGIQDVRRRHAYYFLDLVEGNYSATSVGMLIWFWKRDRMQASKGISCFRHVMA